MRDDPSGYRAFAEDYGEADRRLITMRLALQRRLESRWDSEAVRTEAFLQMAIHALLMASVHGSRIPQHFWNSETEK